MINFVSNLPAELKSGGFSAINACVLDIVSRRHEVRYVGPVDPRVIAPQKLMSKLRRVSGLQANFSYYSTQRLSIVAREVGARCAPQAAFDCFHGFTPWVLTTPPRPYLAWSDCCFRDYIDVYHDRSKFRDEDLKRIEEAEAAWLKRAERTAFTSAWAADRAAEAYGLDRDRISVVGIFGEMDMPDRDIYAGARQFIFVSTNFTAKGGPVALAAFAKVRERYPDAVLYIVGDAPKGTLGPGVIASGFLYKENQQESALFRDILAGSRALLHPTTSDMTPLSVVEAGYYGCPAISSRNFAIPELIDHERTGLLLERPGDVSSLAEAMMQLLGSEPRYAELRKAAWTKARAEHSKVAFERRFLPFLQHGVRGGSADPPMAVGPAHGGQAGV